MDEKKMAKPRQPKNQMKALVGALCEVMTLENQLVCLGRLAQADNRELTLVSAVGRELPPVIYNTQFKLRIYRLAEAPLEMTGYICGNHAEKWQFDRLVDLNVTEKRTHFRLHTKAAAYVCSYGPEQEQGQEQEQPVVGVVLDISVGGLQLRCRQEFERGEKILVQKVRLGHQAEPFDFLCEVRWVKHRPERADWYYGCLFSPPLSPQQEDRLCSAIFALQRHELHRHRNG